MNADIHPATPSDHSPERPFDLVAIVLRTGTGVLLAGVVEGNQDSGTAPPMLTGLCRMGGRVHPFDRCACEVRFLDLTAGQGYARAIRKAGDRKFKGLAGCGDYGNSTVLANAR